MVHCDFKWGFIADLNRTIILILVHMHCVVYYFQHAHGRHRITPFILIKMKIGFLHSEASSNAEVENAMISDCVLVCSKYSGI